MFIHLFSFWLGWTFRWRRLGRLGTDDAGVDEVADVSVGARMLDGDPYNLAADPRRALSARE
jgi:hypothetical protein